MVQKSTIPTYVSIVTVVLGCVDLMRGFIHTLLVEHAAGEIAGLDLSTPISIDLLILMVAFGISNFLTGTMLIFLGVKARPLALAMLGIIPVAYAIGFIGLLQVNSTSYAPSQAVYPGRQLMTLYLGVCIVTFLSAIVQTNFKTVRHDARERTEAAAV